jgi:hypothetical protein
MKRLGHLVPWALGLTLLLTHGALADDPIEALRQAEREVNAKRRGTLGQALKKEENAGRELVGPQQGIGGTAAPGKLIVAGGTPGDEAARLRKNAAELRSQVRVHERAAAADEKTFPNFTERADAERRSASSSRFSAQQAQNQTERERLEAEAAAHDRTADQHLDEAHKIHREAAEHRAVAEGLRREAIDLVRHARNIESKPQVPGTPTDEADRLTRNAKDLRELAEQDEREARVAEQNARELKELADAERKRADSLRARGKREEADSADQRAKELSEEARKQQRKAEENKAVGDGLRREAENIEKALNSLSSTTVGPPGAGGQPVSAEMTVVVENRQGTIVCLPKGKTVPGLDGEVIAEGPTEVLVATSKSPEEVQRLAKASGVTLCFVEIDFCVIKTPLTAFRGHEHRAHPRGLHRHDAPDPPWDWGVTPPEPVVAWGGE